MSQSVPQVKGLLIRSALKVETKLEQNGVGFQIWHSLPAPSVQLSHTGWNSQA